MPGLSDYLLGVAYGESRFTPTAQNGEERNSARGLFQMRPDTAFRKNNGLEHLRNKPEKLLDRKMAMVTAIDYIAAAGKRAQKEGVQIDWAAVRRWWVYPKLLTDFARTHDRSKKVDRVFPEHLGKAGANPGIFDKMANTHNYPGIKETAKFFGVKV